MRHLLSKAGMSHVQVNSAGVGATPGFPATRFAHEAVGMWDLNLVNHKSRPVTTELIENTDLILTMTPGHLHTVVSMAPAAASRVFTLKSFPEADQNGDGIDDPMGSPRDVYNKVFLEIAEELGRILPYVIELARQKNTAAEAPRH